MPARSRPFAVLLAATMLSIQGMAPPALVAAQRDPGLTASVARYDAGQPIGPGDGGWARPASRRAFFPTQGRGDRGEDVKAIQRLLRHRGRKVAVNGVFGPRTRLVVRGFQAARGLRRTGVVDPTTWKRLVVSLERGDRGPAVRAAQELMRQKARVAVPTTGKYGRRTAKAVKRFQRRVGLKATGRIQVPTWRALAWHYQRPDFRLPGLCDYDTMNGPEGNWGTASAIAWLERASRLFYRKTGLRIAVGDVSVLHGGFMPGHHHHDLGLEADIRPIRADGRQCGASGVNIRYGNYDRKATRLLIWALRKAAPGHVQYILFNDRAFLRDGLTTYAAGHDDHLHIRWCEAWHPVPEYRCGYGW